MLISVKFRELERLLRLILLNELAFVKAYFYLMCVCLCKCIYAPYVRMHVDQRRVSALQKELPRVGRGPLRAACALKLCFHHHHHQMKPC